MKRSKHKGLGRGISPQLGNAKMDMISIALFAVGIILMLKACVDTPTVLVDQFGECIEVRGGEEYRYSCTQLPERYEIIYARRGEK